VFPGRSARQDKGFKNKKGVNAKTWGIRHKVESSGDQDKTWYFDMNSKSLLPISILFGKRDKKYSGLDPRNYKILNLL